MTDGMAFANLLAFSAQAALIGGAALALPTLLRLDSATMRYALWRATLALCLLLPWLQPRIALLAGSSRTAIVAAAVPADGPENVALEPASVSDLTWLLVAVLAAGIVVRAVFLAFGFVRLRTLRTAGHSATAEYRELSERLGVRADVRYVDEARQPVAFGWRRPVIVLPSGICQRTVAIREAVVAHELMHIKRGDWPWLVVEEVVRSFVWFHPVLWALISRVQLAREEVVDELAVAATGRRRAYLEALVDLSHTSQASPAPAFAWRRHLFRRIALVAKEDVMSARRVIGSTAAAAIVVGAIAWYAANLFPLKATDLPAAVQAAAGPIERGAQEVSNDNPMPRRTTNVPIEVPQELHAAGASATVAVKLTVDAAGNVAEARVTWLDVQTPGPAVVQATIDAVVAAALDGVKRWQFSPPTKGPVTFQTRLTFGSGRYALVGGRPLPPPPPPPPDPRSAGSSSARPPAASTRTQDVRFEGLRVGGDLPAPTKIRDVRPVYPQEALEARVDGIVVLEIRIDQDGLVDAARVLRSVPLLDPAAIDAVRQWQFTPTLLNGVATPVVLVVTVQFSLAP